MKDSLRTLALATGIALAGIGGAVGVAGAQGYGGDDQPQVEVEVDAPVASLQDDTDTDTAADTDAADEAPGVAAFQDTEAPVEDNAEDDGQRGCNGKLGTAAEAIGIEVDALRAQLDAGQSIADVATANGVSPDAVADAMIDSTEERLDDKVAEGRLTQDEADAKLIEKIDRIEDKVFGSDDEVDGPTAS